MAKTAKSVHRTAPKIDHSRLVGLKLHRRGLYEGFTTEFSDQVPRDYIENIMFRNEVLRKAQEDPVFRARQVTICKVDPLYWINTFCWTYDPRKSWATAQPFITYEFQDESISDICRVFGVEDIPIAKSRDMGASWMCIAVFAHAWQFYSGTKLLAASRKEALVDDANNSDSLFWKVDFLIKNQPLWLVPNYKRKYLSFENVENGSLLNGESTTGDLGRAGRALAILLDESASMPDGYKVLMASRDVTECRVFNSTPKGMANSFADVYHKALNTGKPYIRLHWTRHPEKAAGLYTAENGKVKILDKTFNHPENYQFRLDGKVRSPWYDQQEDRCVHSAELAQEVEIDFMGSNVQFFENDLLEACKKDMVIDPVWVGDVHINSSTARVLSFGRRRDGHLKMWINPDVRLGPPADRNYAIGCDIAFGTGATPSVAVFADKRDGAKVAEYTNNMISPEQFAQTVVALGRWFEGADGKPAFLAWESNGPGRTFGAEVIRHSYGPVYFRDKSFDSIDSARSNFPGWHSTSETKRVLLASYKAALRDRVYINRSASALKECYQWVFTPTGKIAHGKSLENPDPTGVGDNHSDHVIADALCVLALARTAAAPERPRVLPINCAAARMEQAERERREEDYRGWALDDREDESWAV